MRKAILLAALREFAAVGYARATIPVIAAKAETSVGNVYKYFANKEVLFETVIPQPFVVELRKRLEQRMKSIGTSKHINDFPHSHPYRAASEELLQFAISHRLELQFLLRRAAGTQHEHFSEDIVDDLVRLCGDYAKKAYPDFQLTPLKQRVLHRFYRTFIEQISATLSEEQKQQNLREAIDDLTDYHLNGIRAFFKGRLGSR